MAITAPVPVPPIPTPVPTSADPASFDARADATLAALPAAVDGMNAVGTNVYNNALEAMNQATLSQTSATTSTTKATEAAASASAAANAASQATNADGYFAESVTPITPGLGVKTFAIQAGKLFSPNLALTVESKANPTVRGRGKVSAASSGSVSINFTSFSGSGTFSDWLIYLTSFEGLPLATSNVGKVAIVRNVGTPPIETWVADNLTAADNPALSKTAVAFALVF